MSRTDLPEPPRDREQWTVGADTYKPELATLACGPWFVRQVLVYGQGMSHQAWCYLDGPEAAPLDLGTYDDEYHAVTGCRAAWAMWARLNADE